MSTWNPQDPDNARRNLRLAPFTDSVKPSRTERVNRALLITVMVLGALVILFMVLTNSF